MPAKRFKVMVVDDKTKGGKPMEALIRKRIGEIPILQTVIQRLELREILSSYIKTHGNETVPAVDTLLLLVCNIACGRDNGLLGHAADVSCAALYGDDRFGRALNKLYAADRASMVIDIALRVIKATGVDLNELHNDSTSMKTYGKMPGKTATGLYFTQGHSKDHRPDLKQIVYNLTISADGAIPIHYKTYRYDQVHRHSTLKFVTPAQRHCGDDGVILEQRHALYEAAKARRPEHWSGPSRHWESEKPST